MKKPLTDRQYVTRGGMQCPLCHKNEVEGQDVHTDFHDGSDLSRKCYCRNCHASWYEEFKMIGITYLRNSSHEDIEH